ncbi:superoxide dismutase [Cu-Zn] SodC [Pusillimonas sp.]|uniref:superoxide dismutase [Cu-Zn] SodC n=1 Tax=Pusillimonas sp. TaxID=3040095 RepID=UPI0037CA7D7C
MLNLNPYLRAARPDKANSHEKIARRRRAAHGLVAVVFLTAGVLLSVAQADVKVTLHQVTPEGVLDEVGQVAVSESGHGLVFTPNLKGLEPGVHGFHVHENPNCDPHEHDGKMMPAGAAGGHYDPEGSKKHGSPWGDGHLGDLPALYVDAEGNAQLPVLAPRLTQLDQIKGRSLMVHEGGDNYSDHPLPLGGGGGRMACGVMK